MFKKNKNKSDNSEDFYELEHSMLKQSSIKSFFSNLFKNTEPFFLITGSALVIVIVFFLILILRGTKTDNYSKFEEIENAIVKIEEKISKYDQIISSLDQIKVQITEYEEMVGRYNNISSATSIRLNMLQKEIDDLNTRKSNNKIYAKSAKQRKSVLQKSNKKRVKYYRVMPGDTLYKISKKHNLTVNKLLNYNKSIVKNIIFPGQKLTVGM
jgi:LysM repeat protein